MRKNVTWWLPVSSRLGLYLTLVIHGLVGFGCGRTEMDDWHKVGFNGGGAGQSSAAGNSQSNPTGGRSGGPGGAEAGGAGPGGSAGGGGNGGAGPGGSMKSGGAGPGGGPGSGGAGPGGSMKSGGAGPGGSMKSGGAGPGGSTKSSGAGSGGSSGGAKSGGAGGGGASGGATGSAGSTAKPPLWRDSREPLCPTSSPYVGPGPIYLWSDGRGVFAATSDDNGHPTIWANNGTGWQTSFTWSGETTLWQGGLSGFPDGPLVVYGGLPCGLQLVDKQGAHCSGDAMYVMDVAVVNRNLAFAVALGRLLQFDGDFWTQVGEGDIEGGASAVWADPMTVVLAGAGVHTYAIQSGKDLVALPGLPAKMSFVAAWAFGASDIWVASADGQLFHHDGNQWSLKTALVHDRAKYPIGPRIRLWGQGGRLFVIFGNLFGRWDGTRVEILETLDGKAYFEALWGNSPSEVFLGVHDPDLSRACPLRARWWNGKTVGPL